MKSKHDTGGHIALYPNFDIAKATLKPDTAPVIAQIVTLMKKSLLSGSRSTAIPIALAAKTTA